MSSVAGAERRVAQHPDQQVAVGDHAVELGAGQRAGEQPGGLVPGRRPGDDLGEHRVVVHADHRAVPHAGVEAQAGLRQRPELAGHLAARAKRCSVPVAGSQSYAGSSA